MLLAADTAAMNSVHSLLCMLPCTGELYPQGNIPATPTLLNMCSTLATIVEVLPVPAPAGQQQQQHWAQCCDRQQWYMPVELLTA